MNAQPELVTAQRPARTPLLQPLREHDFRLLWVGFTTSTLGDQISNSAGVSPLSLAVAGALAQVSVPPVFTTSGALMLLAAIAALANRTMRLA